MKRYLSILSKKCSTSKYDKHEDMHTKAHEGKNTENKDQKKILKVTKENGFITYMETSIILTANLPEIMKVRR